MSCLRAISVLFSLCTVVGSASAQHYIPLSPTCPNATAGLFTTGEQYLDQQHNGVLLNSWSMLMRWQGSMLNPVSYDAGVYTGFHTPLPRTSYQRGAPQNDPSGSAVTQLHGCEAGMILNSWTAPHVKVDGGGWNDMYGYAWAPASRPRAFLATVNGVAMNTDLVVEGSIAVPTWVAYHETNGVWDGVQDPATWSSAQLDFFVYLYDTAHPNLHPISLIAGVFAHGNFPCSMYPNALLGPDYDNGVWFASTPLCTTDLSSGPEGLTNETLSQNEAFYRLHYTSNGVRNLIFRINNHRCAGPGSANDNSCDCTSKACPDVGYSTNMLDYAVGYGGIIAETSVCGVGGCGTQVPDSNVGLAVHASGVAIRQSYH